MRWIFLVRDNRTPDQAHLKDFASKAEINAFFSSPDGINFSIIDERVIRGYFKPMRTTTKVSI